MDGTLIINEAAPVNSVEPKFLVEDGAGIFFQSPGKSATFNSCIPESGISKVVMLNALGMSSMFTLTVYSSTDKARLPDV